MFYPSEETKDKHKDITTDEMLKTIYTKRHEYLSKFTYTYTSDEILLIASDNFNLGYNHAFNELKLLLETSIEDYSHIVKLIEPLMNKISAESIYAIKLREDLSNAGKKGADARNNKYKEMYPVWQKEIEQILQKGIIKSYSAACKIVAKNSTIKIHPDTVKSHTRNPNSKNK